MEKLFKLKEHGTTVKTEIMAGITTFLTMAYILAVNPNMLSAAGMDGGAVFTATALAAALATIVMGLLANYPVALASGMGLNAYFAFTVCLNDLVDEAEPWRIALTAVLVEGVIFIILSAFKFRETLVNTIPTNLKHGITAGIGLFITIVGLEGAGDHGRRRLHPGNAGRHLPAPVRIGVRGLLAIGVMYHFKVKGAILWGILGTWVLGIVAQLCGWYQVNEVNASLIPTFNSASDLLPPSVAPTFFKFDFSYVTKNFFNFAVIVFSFLFVDLFDTVGTLVGVASKGNLLDEDGKLPKVGRALMADAIGTVARRLPGHLHRHQLCGKLFRRGGGRAYRSDRAHNRGSVYPRPVLLPHFPGYPPALPPLRQVGVCRTADDVLHPEGEV